MFRIILVMIIIPACYKWGNWRNWKEYYPTMLYYIIGDLSYNVLFHDKMLWEFRKMISHTFSDYFDAFFIAPFAIIIFLTHFPVKLSKTLLYTFFWACLFTLVEFLSYVLGYIIYANGWNIFWSFGIYYFLFLLLRVHYHKPLLTWPISLGLAVATLVIFKVPLTSI